MKLNVRGFSIAVGTVLAAAFSVCAFFVAVAPEATAAFLGYLLHINLAGLTQALSWPSYSLPVFWPSGYGPVCGPQSPPSSITF